MDKIYVVRGTEQAGPFTEAEIRAQLASGALTGDSMIWWDGLPEWTPLSRTPLGDPATTATGAPAPGAIPPAPAPFAGSVVAPAAGRTSTLAIVSLVSALLGLVCGLGCIVAVITGHLARGEFKRDPTLGGKGLALAGLIIGYVEIALIAIFLALYFTIIGVAVHQGMKNATFTPTLQDSGTNSSDSNSTPTTPDADTNSASTNGAPATPDTDTNSPSTNSPTATPSQ